MDNDKINSFFKKLDRSIFLDNEFKQYAHFDEALSIGFEQTISKPTLVYGMTCMLGLEKTNKVLEIGTGSGYQTAFLAEFAAEVYTVERIKELSWKAVERLMELGYDNVNFKIGNGSEGWPEFAPYDRIIVTAAASKVPQQLIEQLKPGGRIVIPVGEKGKQELLMIQKRKDGQVERHFMGEVSFVELKGDYGWKQ